MPYSEYPKGSEWRKWDLHVQTMLDDGYIPLADYAGDLKKEHPTKWQEYIAKVGGEEKALLYDSKAYFGNGTINKTERCNNYVRNFFAFLEVFNPGLACLGISDHNYFDDMLLDEFVKYATKTKCKVVPGVEINCGGIHMLLFFGRIPCNQETVSEGIKTLLKRLDITTRNTGSALTVTSKDPKKVIDAVVDEGGIVIFPHCNSDNGLFQERSKTDRTHLANIFNHQPINLLQAQSKVSALAIDEYIGKNAALTSKARCHISADSRSLRDIGRCDTEGHFLWIKADPTFEGLKQIMFEPEQRIFIGPQKPEEKKSYFVVDKVRFLDNTGDPQFSSEVIEINQHLTTIIGGKSTGKSLLLYYMAKTIDPVEVENRIDVPGVPVGYDFDNNPDFNFEVTWGDGQKSLLKTVGGAEQTVSQERKLLYIPQRYLNTLSESNFKSREALNEFVLKVILQDESVREQHESAFREIRAAQKNLPSDVAKLFLEQDDITKTEEELKQIGDEKGIKDYITSLQTQVDEIKAKSGLTNEESAKYESLTARQKEINTVVSNLTGDKVTVENVDAALAAQVEGLQATVSEHEDYLNDDGVKKQFKEEFKVLDALAPALAKAKSDIITAIDKKLLALNTELTGILAALAPLLAKVKLQSELSVKGDAIKKEEQKLNNITIKRNALKTKKAAHTKQSEAVLETYKKMFAKYETLRIEFKKYEDRFGEITLNVLVGFNEEAFNAKVVNEYLNKRDLKRSIPETEWGEDFAYHYDSSKHINNVTQVFNGLLNGTISTLKGRLPKDAVTKLLENYFHLDFRIYYKGDSFDKMSPGKKGLVLLQLLISLSNEEWPILLDQPDDDLDSRSVYEDLVSFLKKRKVQRQIIVVTHNPNLVVGADAEEVVVANQAGQEVSRDNKKFRFEYVSGALENCFEMSAAEEPAILPRKGIRQHVCEILEGGKEAFQKREQKYNFPESHRRI